MRQVNIHEANRMLGKLVEAAEAGERVILTRAGRPVAQIVRLGRPGDSPVTSSGEVRYPPPFDRSRVFASSSRTTRRRIASRGSACRPMCSFRASLIRDW